MDVIVAISTAFSIHQNIYLGAFGVPIISILNSHFLLALYEADARLRAGTSSSYSIDLRSHGPRRARSPSLPEFAVPFANTIASFDFGAEVEIEEFGSSDAHVVVSEHEYEVGAALVVSRKEDASEELRMA
ncbi:hypothetical protein C8Q77DRAFT_1085000 [Trametes polyzona]|nr:hypothetical protein C8Q77DRAFT_1085000 [Trametes polyzona]